jgi:hypothetical protein
MPETREVQRKADNQESEESPSSLIRPDDPLMRQYEASKKRLKRAVEEINIDEDEKDATVMEMRKFAKKRQSSKIIKK